MWGLKAELYHIVSVVAAHVYLIYQCIEICMALTRETQWQGWRRVCVLLTFKILTIISSNLNISHKFGFLICSNILLASSPNF